MKKNADKMLEEIRERRGEKEGISLWITFLITGVYKNTIKAIYIGLIKVRKYLSNYKLFFNFYNIRLAYPTA